MAKTYNDARKEIMNQFIEGLNKEGLKWFSQRRFKTDARNGKTNTHYHGMNHFRLVLGDSYADTRYFTFNQLREKGYHLKKDSHGKLVGFFSYYDIENKKVVPYEIYEQLEKEKRTMFWKDYVVFNAEQLEGIELEKQAEIKIDMSLIENIARAMGVKVDIGQEKTPCYIPSRDLVSLPNPNLYDNRDAFLATALHELSHASGHTSRLNRDISNTFGSNDYAFEELVAEMSAALLCNHFGIENTVDDNHKAYINSWIKYAKDKPQTIIDAFKKAEDVLDYIINLNLEPSPQLENAKVSKVKKSKATKAEPIEQTESVTLSKIGKSKMISYVVDGIKMLRIDLTKHDGNKAYIELTKEFYDNLNKRDRKKFDKVWGLI